MRKPAAANIMKKKFPVPLPLSYRRKAMRFRNPILILLICLLLLTACGLPEPAQESQAASAVLSAEGAQERIEILEVATAEPEPAFSPVPATDSPSPEPTPSPTPEPTPEPTPSPTPVPTPEPRDPKEIIEEMVITYGLYENAANDRVAELLTELEASDPDAASRWAQVMELWRNVRAGVTVNYKELPDGLPETDELAIVALGYKLNANGTMRDELEDRLKVVLRSAKKYPKAYIVCTGGGTASKKKNVTEAGKMSSWLKKKGVSNKRIITEKQSRTTAQNALYTYKILEKDYPDVTSVAIISSDYHIASGVLYFQAIAILRAEKDQPPRYTVVSNAACDEKGSQSLLSQAGALIELYGDSDTAYDVYHGRYDYSVIPTPEAVLAAPEPSPVPEEEPSPAP